MLKRGIILAKLARISNLPTAPPVLEALLQALSNENSSIDDVVNLIEEDVALSAKVLGLANSPVYRGRTEITNIKTAAIRLGFEEIKNIAMAAIVSSSLSKLNIYEPKRFWLHSLAVGYTAQVIAKRAGGKFPVKHKQHLFSAGLLHDLGALVLYHLFPKESSELIEKLSQTELTIFELEDKEWGITHAEVGEILARHWKLPMSLKDSIAYHHSPWEASKENIALVAAIHLGDFICNNQEFSRLGNNFPSGFYSSTWDMFGLDLEDIPDIIEEVKEAGQKSEIFVALL